MLNIRKTGINARDAARLENAVAQEEKNAADILYIAMMADIELEADETEEAETAEAGEEAAEDE